MQKRKKEKERKIKEAKSFASKEWIYDSTHGTYILYILLDGNTHTIHNTYSVPYNIVNIAAAAV